MWVNAYNLDYDQIGLNSCKYQKLSIKFVIIPVIYFFLLVSSYLVNTMNRKGRPENLELGSMQQPIHLVSSEPALVGMGAATTPTIKLSAAYEFPTTGSNGGKSPAILSAVKQSQDTKLAISTTNTNQQGRENSDLSPSEQNGNAGNYRPRYIVTLVSTATQQWSVVQ